MKNTIQSFTDLDTWKMAHRLVILIYKITKSFPREELYSLVDQMRRAASSTSANIAEGFGRQTYKEKVQYYYQAQGSLTELKNFLLIARDIGYITEDDFRELADIANQTHKLLIGLIRKTKTYVK